MDGPYLNYTLREPVGVVGAIVPWNFPLQIAASLVLVVGALLLVQTFRNLVTLDPGFQTEGVLTGFVNLARLGLPPRSRPVRCRSRQHQSLPSAAPK